MQDLLLLLKYAKSNDYAMYVESVLWLIWVTHPSADVNKLMRLSIAQAKRGNYDEAIAVITKAVEADPTFAEAYNKRASYLYMNADYDECIENAQASLDIFPDHVGALSGLGLCNERKKGKYIKKRGVTVDANYYNFFAIYFRQTRPSDQIGT
jgi:tetratricopeptide (TPR) repeat protein